MSDSFDPYVQWLAVANPARPVDYYTLLGLPLFEADTERIENAYMQQLASVLHHEGGPHHEWVERLQEELLQAADCLANPQARAEYDAQLRATLGAAAADGGTGDERASDDSASEEFDLDPSDPRLDQVFSVAKDADESPAREDDSWVDDYLKKGESPQDAESSAPPEVRTTPPAASPTNDESQNVLAPTPSETGSSVLGSSGVGSSGAGSSIAGSSGIGSSAGNSRLSGTRRRSKRKKGDHDGSPRVAARILGGAALAIIFLAVLIGIFSGGRDKGKARIFGQVLVEGEPLSGAQITFTPIDSNRQRFAISASDQGTFDIELDDVPADAPAGDYKVTITVPPGQAPPRLSVHANYRDVNTTPLIVSFPRRRPVLLDLNRRGRSEVLDP